MTRFPTVGLLILALASALAMTAGAASTSQPPAFTAAHDAMQETRLQQQETELENLRREMHEREARLEKKLERETDRTREWVESAKAYLESTQQNLGLYLTAFSIIIAAVGIFIGWRASKQLDEAKASMKEKLEEAKTIVASCRKQEEQAKKHAANIDNIAQNVNDDTAPTLQERHEVQQVVGDSAYSPESRLKAAALDAGYDNDWQKAASLWEAFTLLDPKDATAYSNWGAALANIASVVKGEEKRALLKKAIEKYEAATEIDKNYAPAYSNWGTALEKLAKLADKKDKKTLLQNAIDKCDAATKINKKLTPAYYNWGVALAALAFLSGLKERKELLQKAIEKFNIATKIDNTYAMAFNNCGAMLAASAVLTTDVEEQRTLFEKATAQALHAEKLSPGLGSYNLACCSARLGEYDACREWLEKCLEQKKIPSCEHLRADEDFASVRGEDWFKEIVAKVCDGEGGQESE